MKSNESFQNKSNELECFSRFSQVKRDSSLEGPENFQGENGGGGFNPPGGSY